MKNDAIQNMKKEWGESGLKENDIVLIHSSIKKIFKRYLKNGTKISPEDILQSLTQSVGPRGTIVLPLFNFDFASGIPFDIRNTPSHMGVLSECGRLHPEAVRTGHPIYSFVAIGHHAELFKDVDNFSGYGLDSPFGILRKLGGKIAVIGLPDQNSMTFYHHVEELHDVDYRYHKEFKGEYTHRDGRTEVKTYGLFVRKLENNVATHVDPMGEILWQKGLYCGSRPDEGHGMRVIEAQAMFEAVSDIIDQGKAEGLLYKISETS